MKFLIPMIILTTVLIGTHHPNFVFAKFDVFAKSFKYWFPKEWGNVSNPSQCRLRVTREHPTALVNCSGYLYKRIDYVYIQFMLFYRYGTIYRNYLFNYAKLEPCEIMKKPRLPRYSNVLVDLILKGVKFCCPLFNHECPYYPGFYYAYNIDVNATISPLLPPVVPVGVYKIYGRAYLKGNVTIGTLEGVGVVKANRENAVTDFSMLNMG